MAFIPGTTFEDLRGGLLFWHGLERGPGRPNMWGGADCPCEGGEGGLGEVPPPRGDGAGHELRHVLQVAGWAGIDRPIVAI